MDLIDFLEWFILVPLMAIIFICLVLYSLYWIFIGVVSLGGGVRGYLGKVIVENKMESAVIILFIVAFIIFSFLTYWLYISGTVNDVTSLIVGLMVLLGTMIAFLGVVYQSRYRINVEVLSKNRQEWVNELRISLSDFFSLTRRAVFEAHYMKLDLDGIGDEEGAHGKKQQFITENWPRIEGLKHDFMQKYYYVKLLLNVSCQSDNNEGVVVKSLLDSMDEIRKEAYIESIEKYACSLNIGSSKLWDDAIIAAEKIIKTEWEKVKKGI